MYQSHSHQTAFCEIACLEFLARFVGIPILVKTGQNYKINRHFMCRPTYDYDLLSILIFTLKADCLPYEMQKVEHEACLILNIKYWYFSAINGISAHLKDLKDIEKFSAS